MNQEKTDALKAIEKHAKDNMKRYGWYCHLVPGNVHTHGFKEKHKVISCKELQDAAEIFEEIL